MKVINKKDFFRVKNSDTIVIYGSGSSVNRLKKKDKSILGKYDSISFNWFCKSHIPTTFYIIREQCNIKKRIHGDENLNTLYRDLNSHYGSSCFVVHQFTYDKKYGHYDHSENLEKINGRGVVVKDKPTRSREVHANPLAVIKRFRKDIFDHGVEHGICSMYNVMHIVTALGYKNIGFIGVDLNNSKYFWLGKKRRHTIARKNKRVSEAHPVRKNTIKLLSLYQQEFPDKKLWVYNKDSALTNIMRTH